MRKWIAFILLISISACTPLPLQGHKAPSVQKKSSSSKKPQSAKTKKKKTQGEKPLRTTTGGTPLPLKEEEGFNMPPEEKASPRSPQELLYTETPLPKSKVSSPYARFLCTAKGRVTICTSPEQCVDYNPEKSSTDVIKAVARDKALKDCQSSQDMLLNTAYTVFKVKNLQKCRSTECNVISLTGEPVAKPSSTPVPSSTPEPQSPHSLPLLQNLQH